MPMGPAHGTPEYKQQVETITIALKELPLHLLNQALVLYIFDSSYSRAAICEAEKILRKAHESET